MSPQQILQKYTPKSFHDKLNQRLVDSPFNAYGMPKNTRYSHLGLMDVGFLGRVGTSTAFSPPDIANLYAWFDASDITTITKDGSDRVSQWDNKEGTSARDLIQSTGGSQPLWLSANRNSLDVIDFVGSRNMATSAVLTAITQPVTMFITLFVPPSGTEAWWWDRHSGGATAERLAMLTDSATNTMIMSGGAALIVVDSGLVNKWQYVTGKFNTTSSDFRFNAVSKATGNVGTRQYKGITMGSTHSGAPFLNTKIAEWIMYDALLTSDEIDQVETYLGDKWGF